MIIDASSVSIALSLASWIALLAFIVKASMRFGALELKVDTMWGFQMRRAMSEIIQTGTGVKNSPLLLNVDAVNKLEPVKEELREWYLAQRRNYSGDTISDANLMLELEQVFGDRLMENVCIPCNVSYGACLILALSVAKNQNPVDIDLSIGKDSVDRH